MEAKCPKCEKVYDTEQQTLCAHRDEGGKLYFINLLYEEDGRLVHVVKAE